MKGILENDLVIQMGYIYDNDCDFKIFLYLENMLCVCFDIKVFCLKLVL